MTVLVSPPPTENPLAGHEEADQAAWDDLGKDGIVHDYLGTSWRVSATGTNTSVSVGTVGDLAEIRGFRCRQSVAEIVPLSSNIPASGQSRFVLVVLRLTRANSTASVVPVYGTASAGTPTPPNFTRNNTFWDLPLAQVRQFGPAGIITQADVFDARQWTGEHQVVASSSDLYGPVGSTRSRIGVLWERRLVDETPTWVDLSTVRIKDLPFGEGGTVARPGGTGRQVLVITPMTGADTPPYGIMRVTLSVDVTGGAQDQDVAGYFWADTGNGVQQGKTRFHSQDGTEGMVSVSLGPVRTLGSPINLQVCASLDPLSAPVTFGRPRTSAWVEYTGNEVA